MVYRVEAAAQDGQSRARLCAFPAAIGARPLSQIQLRISDRRLERRARHRLHEPALLEVEVLHLKLALGRERSLLVLEAMMADVGRKMGSVLARLICALKLLLVEDLLLHPLLHLKLLEAARVRGRQIGATPGEPLPEIEIQGVLLLLDLKLAAMRSHAPLIRRRCRQ
jgi:hypothetical protein